MVHNRIFGKKLIDIQPRMNGIHGAEHSSQVHILENKKNAITIIMIKQDIIMEKRIPMIALW